MKQADNDRYLASLYAPEEKRAALAALYAFNIELASVRERVSQPLPGEMRMQWWRDVLEAGASEGAASPLAEALQGVIQKYALPLQPFINMTEARIFDLYDNPMPSRNDLEGYCGETASALIQLSALILDADAAKDSGEMAGHAGCAQAIAGLLRSLPIHTSRGQCYVPVDILAAAGMSRDTFVLAKDVEGAKRAISALVALGREHLAQFEQQARKLAPSLRPAFLAVALCQAYFDRIETVANPLTEIATISPLRRHWLMFRRAMRGW